MYKAIIEEKELLAKREILKKRIEAKIEKTQKNINL